MSAPSAPEKFEILAEQLVDRAAPLLAERVAALVAERYGEVPPLLDAAGAARYLGADEATVRRWAREGLIPHIRIGDGPKAPLRFDPEALRDELSIPADVTQWHRVSSVAGNGAEGGQADGSMGSWVTTSEAAQILECTPLRVDELAAEGLLGVRTTQVGERRVDLSEVLVHLKSRMEAK
jgi:hypothetical protein